MRKWIGILPLFTLAACGGDGPQTIGGSLAPTGASVTTPNGGTGSGVSAGNGTTGGTAASGTFLDVASQKSFDAVGSIQSLKVDNTTGGVLYAGDASTVRTPSGQISYNPRDGIFTLTVTDTKANVSNDLRFQDPAHRTDFANHRTPQWGVPDLQNFNYLESAGSQTGDEYTFFYQRPGSSTNYVTLAGYVRNFVTPANSTFERGAFVFGDQTVRGQIPTSGTASYSGGFLATMVGNQSGDSANPLPTAFQWLQGDSKIAVDFSHSTVQLQLNGTVNAANMDGYNLANSQLSIPTGATFTATGSGTIDLVKTGGFTGSFQSAAFNSASKGVQTVDFASVSPNSSTAGASSLDGTFFGPNAVNVGGNFRIVGGIPDQRVDIHGAFTGAKVGQ